MEKQEVVYLNIDQATELVDRIAERTKNFSYTMTENEKEAMSELLSSIGVNVSDIIDVSNLADNYAINAEIVTPNDYDNYDMRQVKDDYLFCWNESDGIHYCVSW